MAPIGETPRPKGFQRETGEERLTDDNTPQAVKHVIGNFDGGRNSMSFRKTSYMATWNVQGLTTGELAIIEKEIERCIRFY